MAASSITDIAKELQSLNLTEDLILDTLDGFNPVLNSNIAQQNLEKFDKYTFSVVDLLDTAKSWLSDIYDQLENGEIRQSINTLSDELTGNKLQEEENRREMIEALSNIGAGGSPGNIPPPLPVQDDNGNPVTAGISAGITSVIASRIAAMIPQSVKTMFLPLTAFFGHFLKFGKMLVRFAGPIGIAIAVITGLIGAIKGGIEGFKEGGVEGAIKGALIGAIDGLIGSLVKGVANAAGWLLKAIGLEKLGSLLGPAVEGLFKGVYDIIGGFIEIFAGIFTLDADKVIGGLKKMFTGALGNFKILGELLWTGIQELVPLIWKTIKFTLWDLPKFIGEMLVRAFYFLKENLPGFIDKIGEFIGQLGEKIKTDLLPWLGTQLISLIDSLSVVLTDLLGGVISWVGGLLNWETVEETVFAGVDFIQKMIDGVTNFVTDLIDGIVGFFSDPKGMLDKVFGAGAGDWIEDAYKKILRGFLPDPNGSLKNPLTWVGKIAIPDDVYEWAGLPTSEPTGLNDTTGGVNPYDKKAKAMQAGYSSWEDYKDSGWKWKGPALEASPSVTGAALAQAGSGMGSAPIVINQMGGNVSNTTTSQVNNNVTPFEPIMTGTSMGFVSQ